MRRFLPICLALSAAALAAASPPGSLLAAGTEPAPDAAAIQLVPTPPTSARRELMRRWRRASSDPLAPVLREWDNLARAALDGPGSRLTAGCQRLDLALAGLDRGRLPQAPDPAVSLHLEETLRSLSEAARSCTQGAYFLTTWRLRQAADSWRELRGRLVLYRLSP